MKNVKECLGTFKYAIRQSGSPRSWRDNLAQRHSTAISESNKRLFNGDTNLGAALPICTAIFEVIDIRDAYMVGVALVPRQEMTHDPKVRVAYNRTYPCTQASHSMLAFLESNMSFRPVRHMRRYCTYCKGIPAHSLRILPINGDRPSIVDLPPNVLHNIILEAIPRNDHTGRAMLMSYGTVCKSWAHILNIFFSHHDRMIEGPITHLTAISVARSLHWKPERAKLMRTFITRNYSDTLTLKRTAGDIKYLESCQALIKIIELATSVEQVKLQAIHEECLSKLALALSQLRHVTSCEVFGDHPQVRHANPRRRGFCINDIQIFIAKWSHLSRLDLISWDKYVYESR